VTLAALTAFDGSNPRADPGLFSEGGAPFSGGVHYYLNTKYSD